MARKLIALRLSSDVNCPETRMAIFSAPASTVPLGWIAFCACSVCYQAGDVEAHGGELLGRELEIDLLVLRADEIDLGNVRHAQQLAAQALGVVAQLAVREAVGGQREDEGIGVAELVVEERTLQCPAARSA